MTLARTATGAHGASGSQLRAPAGVVVALLPAGPTAAAAAARAVQEVRQGPCHGQGLLLRAPPPRPAAARFQGAAAPRREAETDVALPASSGVGRRWALVPEGVGAFKLRAGSTPTGMGASGRWCLACRGLCSTGEEGVWCLVFGGSLGIWPLGERPGFQGWGQREGFL